MAQAQICPTCRKRFPATYHRFEAHATRCAKRTPRPPKVKRTTAWLRAVGKLGASDVSRAAAKARADRAEAKQIQAVRAKCVRRDGYCRFSGGSVGPCSGRSEWAHFDEHRRFKTRGMDPAERHSTAGSFMACTGHHRAYDAHEMTVSAIDQTLGADGPLRAVRSVV